MVVVCGGVCLAWCVRADELGNAADVKFVDTLLGGDGRFAALRDDFEGVHQPLAVTFGTQTRYDLLRVYPQHSVFRQFHAPACGGAGRRLIT